MLFMNDSEIDYAERLFRHSDAPNLQRASRVLASLARWANHNSDGWHSWPKPCRAAKSLQELLQAKARDYRDDGRVSRAGESGVVEFTDATDAELKRVLSPIKAFLTRQQVSQDVATEILNGEFA